MKRFVILLIPFLLSGCSIKKEEGYKYSVYVKEEITMHVDEKISYYIYGNSHAPIIDVVVEDSKIIQVSPMSSSYGFKALKQGSTNATFYVKYSDGKPYPSYSIIFNVI